MIDTCFCFRRTALFCSAIAFLRSLSNVNFSSSFIRFSSWQALTVDNQDSRDFQELNYLSTNEKVNAATKCQIELLTLIWKYFSYSVGKKIRAAYLGRFGLFFALCLHKSCPEFSTRQKMAISTEYVKKFQISVYSTILAEL